MVKLFFGTMLIVATLTSCSSSNDVCEDVTLASEQMQQCQSLHRQILQAKGKPLIRTELDRRYQQDCLDLRYYRDEQQAAICGNKHKKSEAKEALKKEMN
jgi:hypothetical protein